ncbi:hypothetical protein AVEN_64636-1 [Araneus ventricosus]|uniref:Uncharacterized protein n=1 Tax=Araneus ventricosus TaxID=182803 RepID=A0A4Y2RF39_ARAVE|nr:hypothetical protein AVEN_64636-1 [Araneus ventricosus]
MPSLVAFNSIECELPGIDSTNLSCDQKYLLDICTAISSGVGSSDLAKHQMWTLHLARWDGTCGISSAHLDSLYKNYSGSEPVISRNAYFAAPENMLFAMLTDERCYIRTLAARRIIKAREIGLDGNCVRRFVIPAVNFQVTDYVDLIDWQACTVTLPPVLRQISSHELLKMIQDGMPMDS